MRKLTECETTQISGGVHCQQMATDVGPYVFYSTGIGMLLSAFYALGTAQMIKYEVQGKMVSSLSIGPTFLKGQGLFSLGGMAVGMANHLYHFYYQPHQQKEDV